MKRMHQLADEIRETFEDRGWKIEKATQLDLAFRKTRRSRSSLGRDLVLDAIEEATTRIGLGCQSVSGGGRDVIDLVDGTDRRFRVRKADIDPETGEYDIICKSDSILVVTDTEPESLIPTERWVLGYTVDDEGMVVDIFAGTGSWNHRRCGPTSRAWRIDASRYQRHADAAVGPRLPASRRRRPWRRIWTGRRIRRQYRRG